MHERHRMPTRAAATSKAWWSACNEGQKLSSKRTMYVPQDTFLDADHVRESFPGHRVEVVNNSGQPAPVRPFRVTFPEPPADPDANAAARPGAKRKAANGTAANGTADQGEAHAASAELPVVRVESYRPPDPGPYPQDEPPQNTVRFTPVQVEAIRAGAQPGLTMVVGPPGAHFHVAAMTVYNRGSLFKTPWPVAAVLAFMDTCHGLPKSTVSLLAAVEHGPAAMLLTASLCHRSSVWRG